MLTDYWKEKITKIKEEHADDQYVMELCAEVVRMKEDKEGDDVLAAKQIEDYVNTCPNNYDKFVSYITGRAHRYLQGEVFKLFIKCINKWANYPEFMFDDRNAFVKLYCTEIKESMKNRRPYLFPDEEE